MAAMKLLLTMLQLVQFESSDSSWILSLFPLSPGKLHGFFGEVTIGNHVGVV